MEHSQAPGPTDGPTVRGDVLPRSGLEPGTNSTAAGGNPEKRGAQRVELDNNKVVLLVSASIISNELREPRAKHVSKLVDLQFPARHIASKTTNRA